MIVEIIDIGSGNIKSIQNWIERLHVPTKVITKATDIKSEFVILPGVGSAGSYMKRIKNKDFDKAILEHVDKGNRLLGICLGFQLMGHSSEEDGGVEGLNILNGTTKKVKKSYSHNGWEKFTLRKDELKSQSFNSTLKLTKKQNINGRVFYNHEYGFVLDDSKSFNKAISTQYDKYSSIVVSDNIIGIQFHPEKSQQTGLDLMSIIL